MFYDQQQLDYHTYLSTAVLPRTSPSDVCSMTSVVEREPSIVVVMPEPIPAYCAATWQALRLADVAQYARNSIVVPICDFEGTAPLDGTFTDVPCGRFATSTTSTDLHEYDMNSTDIYLEYDMIQASSSPRSFGLSALS